MQTTEPWSARQARRLMEQALLGPEPSRFFEQLRQRQALSPWFQEVQDLIGVPQSPVHHAEGDVWTHTMMVLDQAARMRTRSENPLGFMLGALTHDFGKTICTQEIQGRICSYEHERKGLPLVERFLQRLQYRPEQCVYVLELVCYHMLPNAMASQNASVKATNRLFDKVSDPQTLIALAAADGLGKRSTLPFVSYDSFLLERLELYRECLERPAVTREELAAVLPPQADLDQCMAFAHKLMLAGVPRAEVLTQTVGQSRSGNIPLGTNE